MENMVYKIGIRREEFSKWERRVVITPAHCKKLIFQLKGRLEIKVQPSNIRIFSDTKFEEAGCLLTENINDCDLILGVKQVPVENLIPGKTYMFFSHTTKAQPQNMPMLDVILERKIRLIDYEKITDENGKRLVAFGVFAGNAGTIDILMGLGSFLLNRGIGSPFINISQSYHYMNIDNAKDSIRGVGSVIENNGLCHLISPFIVGITGTGRCASGTLEILKLLPHEFIEPEELADLIEDASRHPNKYNKQVFICQFQVRHLVQLKNPNGRKFCKVDYYANPENYQPKFEREYLKYLSLLINNIYWDDRFPRLITEDYLKEHVKIGLPLRLLGISDITADFKGSIDFLKKFTTIDAPFFVYDPATGNIDDSYKNAKNGILYCSIENHPSQFPVDASNYFSCNLFPFIQSIVKLDPKRPLEDQALIGPLARAVITDNGSLTNLFTYINKLRKERDEVQKKGVLSIEDFRAKNFKCETINLYLEGHIFDTRAINELFDILVDRHHFNCTILKWVLGRGQEKETSCVVKIVDRDDFNVIFQQVEEMLRSKKINYKFVEEEYVA